MFYCAVLDGFVLSLFSCLFCCCCLVGFLSFCLCVGWVRVILSLLFVCLFSPVLVTLLCSTIIRIISTTHKNNNKYLIHFRLNHPDCSRWCITETVLNILLHNLGLPYLPLFNVSSFFSSLIFNEQLIYRRIFNKTQ